MSISDRLIKADVLQNPGFQFSTITTCWLIMSLIYTVNNQKTAYFPIFFFKIISQKQNPHHPFQVFILNDSEWSQSVRLDYDLMEYSSFQHIDHTFFSTRNPSIQHQKPLSSTPRFLVDYLVETLTSKALVWPVN